MNAITFSSTPLRRTVSGITLAVCCLFLAGRVRAQQLTQTVVVQPGWNAVWLEVDPTNRAPAAVFAGLPLLSVWTWSERVSATDFIQNPASAGWNKNQWLGWFPTNRPEAPLANLFSIVPARAYLIHSGSPTPVTWQITGTVVPQPTTWTPNLYNLRGLPVDSNAPPTFRQFFQDSPAHWDPVNNTTTPIYRLSANGMWSLVSPDDTMNRDVAYWIFVNGASGYPAPFSLAPATGAQVYFSPLAERTTLTVANLSAETRTLNFRSLSPPSLGIEVENPLQPNPLLKDTLLSSHSEQLQPGQQVIVTLFLDRTQTPPGPNQTLFTVSDEQGTLQYLGVSSDGEGDLGASGVTNSAYPLAGLWLGTASLNAVGEVDAANPGSPTPVPTPFAMRLIIFVDTNGAAVLMREATLVNLPGVNTNIVTTNNLGVAVTNIATISGGQVLLSNPALINQYRARYQNTAGTSVRRYTAAQFDNAVNTYAVPMTGSFITNGTLTCTLSIPFNYGTNPFYHRYHPDHDNLDPTYQFVVPEAYSVTRQVELDFSGAGSGVPSYGVDGLDGTYQETVSGLHKLPLLTSGTFTLQRVSTVPVLNPPLQ